MLDRSWSRFTYVGTQETTPTVARVPLRIGTRTSGIGIFRSGSPVREDSPKFFFFFFLIVQGPGLGQEKPIQIIVSSEKISPF